MLRFLVLRVRVRVRVKVNPNTEQVLSCPYA